LILDDSSANKQRCHLIRSGLEAPVLVKNPATK
jgi:hypothetical protein